MTTTYWQGVLIAPLSVPQSKTKNFILNLNTYRNAHYQTLNTVKKRYKEHMTNQILTLPEFSEIKLSYTLYPGSMRICDVNNVLSVHDKFFCDALVELGKLEDDNYNYLQHTIFNFGRVDKNYPRVEILVRGNLK